MKALSVELVQQEGYKKRAMLYGFEEREQKRMAHKRGGKTRPPSTRYLLFESKPDCAFRTYTYIITNARDSRFSRSRMSQRNESFRSTVISSRRIRPNKNWVSKRESFMPAMCPSYDLQLQWTGFCILSQICLIKYYVRIPWFQLKKRKSMCLRRAIKNGL